MIIRGTTFCLAIWHPLEDERNDLEFYLYYKGKRYFGWAFTLDGILQVMRRHSISGENAFGTYFALNDMIIVHTISETTLIDAIADVIEQGALETTFSYLDDELPDEL